MLNETTDPLLRGSVTRGYGDGAAYTRKNATELVNCCPWASSDLEAAAACSTNAAFCCVTSSICVMV